MDIDTLINLVAMVLYLLWLLFVGFHLFNKKDQNKRLLFVIWGLFVSQALLLIFQFSDFKIYTASNTDHLVWP